jgi:hypothetical protein
MKPASVARIGRGELANRDIRSPSPSRGGLGWGWVNVLGFAALTSNLPRFVIPAKAGIQECNLYRFYICSTTVF